MFRIVLAAMMIAIMAGVGAMLSLLPVTAQQDDPSANRSFSPATVAPGERVTVTITVANYGQAGSVVETLPSGFTWVSSTHPSGQVDRDGQEVTFTLFGETSLTYSVTASSTERQYSFSGTLWDFDGEEHDVLGPPVTVRAAPAPAQDDPSANRSFSSDSGAGRAGDGDHHRRQLRPGGQRRGDLAFRVHLGIQHSPQRPGRP